jgi:hypothetical protein
MKDQLFNMDPERRQATVKEQTEITNQFALQFQHDLRECIDEERAHIRSERLGIPSVKSCDMNRTFRAIDRLIIRYALGIQHQEWCQCEKALKGLISLSNCLNRAIAKASMSGLMDYILPDLELLVRTQPNDAMLMLLLMKEESFNLDFRMRCEAVEDRWMATVLTAHENRKTH